MKTKLAQAAAVFLLGMTASATIAPPPCVGQTCPAAIVSPCGAGKLPDCGSLQADLRPDAGH